MSIERTCTVDTCDRASYSRGWCRRHYQQMYRHGEIRERPSAAERFWVKVDKAGPPPHDSPREAAVFGVCWIWTGAHSQKGYGWFKVRRGRTKQAHVFAWEEENGAVPKGLELDHFICDRRDCVRPSHLRAVTHYDNVMRSPVHLWRRTHCNYGHPFEGTNLLLVDRGDGTGRTKRCCRTCRERWRANSAARLLALRQ